MVVTGPFIFFPSNRKLEFYFLVLFLHHFKDPEITGRTDMSSVLISCGTFYIPNGRYLITRF